MSDDIKLLHELEDATRMLYSLRLHHDTIWDSLGDPRAAIWTRCETEDEVTLMFDLLVKDLQEAHRLYELALERVFELTAVLKKESGHGR